MRGGGVASYDNSASGCIGDRTLAVELFFFYLQELWITSFVVSRALTSLRVILLINSSRYVTTTRVADNGNSAPTKRNGI